MKCSICENGADFVCLCQYLAFCPVHMNMHKDQNGNHLFESLSTNLSPEETKFLKEELLSRIMVIEQSFKHISCSTKSIIKKIIKYKNRAFNHLENLKKLYVLLVKCEKYSSTLIKEAQIVNLTKIRINKVSTKISKELKKSFTHSLVDFIDLSQSKSRDEERYCVNKVDKWAGNENVDKEEGERKNQSFSSDHLSRKTRENDLRINFNNEVRGHIALAVKEKMEIMESLNISNYQENFVKQGIYAKTINEIKFSADSKLSFICKNYLGIL